MKKVLFILFVALLVLPMSAQVSRSGNQYYADGQLMKAKDFATYMQANAEANLATKFKSGQIVADVGWGLFGGGLGVTAASFITTGAIINQTASQGLGQAVAGTVSASIIGGTIVIIGAAATTAGIICLGVGYGCMHKSADTFIASRQAKPQAYLSLQADQNGLGLALHF